MFQSSRARERAARESTGVCLLQLHLVGADPQSQALLLSDRTDGRGGRFWVRVDDGLARQVARALTGSTDYSEDEPGDGFEQSSSDERASERAVFGAWRGPGRVVPGPSSPDPATFEELIRTGGGYRGSLSPREIQARLRQGRTLAEVAQEAGVETEWVERFAGPILAERRSALDRALALRLVGSAGDVSALPLGEAVERNLARRGFETGADWLAEHWSASHLDGAQWVIKFHSSDGRREIRAEWTAELEEGRLSASSPLSAQLAFAEGSPEGPGVTDPPGGTG